MSDKWRVLVAPGLHVPADALQSVFAEVDDVDPASIQIEDQEVSEGTAESEGVLFFWWNPVERTIYIDDSVSPKFYAYYVA